MNQFRRRSKEERTKEAREYGLGPMVIKTIVKEIPTGDSRRITWVTLAAVGLTDDPRWVPSVSVILD